MEQVPHAAGPDYPLAGNSCLFYVTLGYATVWPLKSMIVRYLHIATYVVMPVSQWY